MPSVSRNQRITAAIAEHNPSELYAKNKGMLSMSHSQLHDFAATKGLGKKKRAPMSRQELTTFQSKPHRGFYGASH